MTKHTVDPTLREPHIAVYDALREAWNEYGFSPSKIELRNATHYSITTVNKVVKDLKAKGYITAPKFQVRQMKPTDLDRTLSIAPLPPWEALTPPRKYFVLEKRKTHR